MVLGKRWASGILYKRVDLMNKCPSTVSFWLSYERELSYMDLNSLTYLILIIEVINLCLKSWIKCISLLSLVLSSKSFYCLVFIYVRGGT